MKKQKTDWKSIHELVKNRKVSDFVEFPVKPKKEEAK